MADGVQPVVGTDTMLSYSRTEYDAAGRVYRSYTQNEDETEICTTEYVYDAAGRQIQTITLPDDVDNRTVTETHYDGTRRDYVVDARQNTTSFSYDSMGRVSMTDLPEVLMEGQGTPAALYVHTGYDGLGRKRWQSDPVLTSVAENIEDDDRKSYEYDPSGQLAVSVLPPAADPQNSDTWTWQRYVYTYDAYGNLQTISDKVRQWASPFDPAFDPQTDLDGSVSRQTTFGYDELNRQIRRTLPNDQSEYTSYDLYGRIETQTAFNGHYSVYEYDTLGRLAYQRYYVATAAYDSDHPTYNATPEIAYVYDNLNRLITQTVTEYDAAGQVVGTPQAWEMFYDNEGRLERLESPQGIINYDYSSVTGRKIRLWTDDTFETADNIVEYGYDNLGRLGRVTVKKRNGLTVDESTYYTCNPVGSIESITYPNGNYAYHWYNALNWLVKLTNFAHYETDPENPTGAILSSFEYTYYADGMRASVTETLNGVTQTTTWQYDNLNRLIEEDRGGGNIDRYEYDLVGNRLAIKDGLDQSIVSYGYNTLDQLETEDYTNPATTDYSYAYDANGSLTRRYHGLDQQTAAYDEYGYNLQKRMTSFTPSGGSSIAYQYDPDGIRISKTVSGITTDYLIDPYNPTGYAQVLVADDGTNQTFYAIGADIVGQTVNTNNAVYMLYDGHGSTRQLADASGSLISGQTFNYDAYGNRLDAAVEQTNLLYTGEWYDIDLDWNYNRDRWSVPSLGIFNQMDRYPGDNDDPQSLHRYLYCKSNPVNFIDPSGQSYISPSIWRLIQEMEPEQVLRILIGIRVTYKMGEEYIKEEGRNPLEVDINLQIARISDDLETEGVEWNGLFKMRPDISDRGRGDVYEVRPDNPAAVTKGQADVMKYIGVLHQRHSGKTFFPGAWQPQKPVYLVDSLPGISGMKPLMVTARNAGGGVIAYRVNDIDLGDRVFEIVDMLRMAGLASVAIQVNQALTVAQTMNVAKIAMQRAVMVPTTETVRLKDDIGIAMINTTIGAGVP